MAEMQVFKLSRKMENFLGSLYNSDLRARSRRQALGKCFPHGQFELWRSNITMKRSIKTSMSCRTTYRVMGGSVYFLLEHFSDYGNTRERLDLVAAIQMNNKHSFPENTVLTPSFASKSSTRSKLKRVPGQSKRALCQSSNSKSFGVSARSLSQHRRWGVRWHQMSNIIRHLLIAFPWFVMCLKIMSPKPMPNIYQCEFTSMLCFNSRSSSQFVISPKSSTACISALMLSINILCNSSLCSRSVASSLAVPHMSRKTLTAFSLSLSLSDAV
nr:hypothetical protein 13E11.280 [imported] - Neurospora crassa [Neurospora crassa]